MTDFFVVGDLNVHFDNPYDPCTAALNAVLYNLSLELLVNFLTHRRGHTLDWLIPNRVTDVLDLTVADMLLSDHFVISFDLLLRKPGRVTKKVTSRNIRSVDMYAFRTDLPNFLSMPLNLNQLTPLVCKTHVCARRWTIMLPLLPSPWTIMLRPGHNTETALLKVVNDLLLSLDNGNVSLLALLDLSAAFDTIDHSILLHRLEHDFGVSGTALQWFSSVVVNGLLSDPSLISSGVPQGSVLGPVLFVIYTIPLSAIIQTHSVLHHSYADDLQLQKSAPPRYISDLLSAMQLCIGDIKSWMTTNMLKLNDEKTELMLVSSSRMSQLHSLPDSMTINNTTIPFSDSVKNLGVTFDRHLTMKNQVPNIIRSCNFELRRIASIRRFLST